MTRTCHDSFEFVKSAHVPALNLEYQEFKHKKTGATHIHLAADNEENVCFIGFKTVPTDSTGVPHILEHTLLCGSEKYPVNDPFMSMIRRSLNTFMNAMTSSDWTAYPFASCNKKDFNNLLDVYIDAVFFPRLEPLAFAQEGHRLEFTDAENPESDLQFNGVVFNEMKGAYSDEVRRLHDQLASNLHPNSTYHHSSGGRPENITDLSYEEFKAFYEKHYHPSNSTFLTFGDISAAEHQANFEQKALHRFERSDKPVSIENDQRFTSPKVAEGHFPIAEQDNAESRSYVTLSWLLGESSDYSEVLTAQLVSELLIGSSAAPLQQALETTELGGAVAPVTGLNNYQKEMSFTCGLANTNPENAEQIEKLVIGVLENIAKDGFDSDVIEAVLHQFELNQLEITGGRMPYGMELIFNVFTGTNHNSDGLERLQLDTQLAALREKTKQPEFIKGLIQSWFLDNPHRLRLDFTPSKTMAAELEQQEQDKVAGIQAKLSEQDKLDIVQLNKDLVVRQNRKDNVELLPKVTIADVPKAIRHIAPSHKNEGKHSSYTAGTNSLVYQQVVIDLPQLSLDELRLLPIYTSLLPELGIGDSSYLEVEKHKTAILGQYSASYHILADKNDANQLSGNVIFSVNGLSRNQHLISEFIGEALTKVRFDEGQRIRELLSMFKAQSETAVVQTGNALASAASASRLSKIGYIQSEIEGLPSLLLIRKLAEQVQNDDGLAEVTKALVSLHEKVLKQPRQLVSIADKNDIETATASLADSVDTITRNDENELNVDLPLQTQNQAWVTNTQVNFCSTTYPTVSATHPNAPKLSVLGTLLSANFLHQRVREKGGAYGSGAVQNSQKAVFQFSSYRDPRLTETLNDFGDALSWLMSADIDEQKLEEAKLQIIARLDKPESPAGEATSAFTRDFFGNTPRFREVFREQLLAVTLEDVLFVAKKYLLAENAVSAVVTNEDGVKQLPEQLNFETFKV